MRYFIVQEPDEKIIAVVLHDYRKATFICRSKTESFLRAFNHVCDITDTQFVRTDKGLAVQEYGARDYGWIDTVLSKLLGAFWTLKEQGEMSPAEEGIDELASRYLLAG